MQKFFFFIIYIKIIHYRRSQLGKGNKEHVQSYNLKKELVFMFNHNLLMLHQKDVSS